VNAEETEPRLLSAAGHVSPEENASLPGTVPWYRRRSSRACAAVLLVIALILALLLLNDGSKAPVKSATRVTPRPGLRIAGQGLTQLPPNSFNNNWYTFPALGGTPNDGAGQVGGGAVPFSGWDPGTLSDPITVPVEIPAPPPPGGTL
jgi:hypothetical protein